MSEDRPLCPGCFKADVPREGEACPTCGFRPETAPEERSPVALPLKTMLNGRYCVGRVLGKPGGFGITYLAFDTRLRQRVAVKEFIPRDVAARATDGESVVLYSDDEEGTFQYGLDRFLNEAQMLAQFDHANIVGVEDFFEDNGTAYLVMDYYEGKTLKQYLSEQLEGRMDPDNATEIMLRVLDGLKEVHSEGYLHRDIKPANIYLTKEGRPILIDFGAARLALGKKSRSLSVVMTEGYAPYEQYRRHGDQGPWTDVYGCGATLYRMVTGQTPSPAADRAVEDRIDLPHEVNPAVSADLSAAIMEALAARGEERLQSGEAFHHRLQNVAAASSEEAEAAADEQRDAPQKKKHGASQKDERDTSSTGDRSPRGSYRSRRKSRSGGHLFSSWYGITIGILLLAAGTFTGAAILLYPSTGGSSGVVATQTDSSAATAQASASRDPSGTTEADGAGTGNGTSSTSTSRATDSPSDERALSGKKTADSPTADRGDASETEGSFSDRSSRSSTSSTPEDGGVSRFTEGEETQRVDDAEPRSGEETAPLEKTDEETAEQNSDPRQTSGEESGDEPVDSGTDATEEAAAPYHIEGLNRDLEYAPLPEYAPKVTGRVRVQITVNPEGQIVRRIPQRKNTPELVAAVMDALQKWHFNALPPDAPQENQTGTVTFTFRTERSPETQEPGADKTSDSNNSKQDDRSSSENTPPSENDSEKQEVFLVVEDQPELIGGMKALQESVEYPEFAKKAGIEGRVIVQFVVDEEGNVQNPKVVRGVHKLLNEEAIEAVKEQKFEPGKQRGKAVKVQMSLPVTFRMQ